MHASNEHQAWEQATSSAFAPLLPVFLLHTFFDNGTTAVYDVRSIIEILASIISQGFALNQVFTSMDASNVENARNYVELRR